MVFFFHHYELPAILQQARIQQIIIETQAQQGNENANGSDGTDGSGGTDQDDNNNNGNTNNNQNIEETGNEGFILINIHFFCIFF